MRTAKAAHLQARVQARDRMATSEKGHSILTQAPSVELIGLCSVWISGLGSPAVCSIHKQLRKTTTAKLGIIISKTEWLHHRYCQTHETNATQRQPSAALCQPASLSASQPTITANSLIDQALFSQRPRDGIFEYETIHLSFPNYKGLK